jgi:hypothetical protein
LAGTGERGGRGGGERECAPSLREPRGHAAAASTTAAAGVDGGDDDRPKLFFLLPVAVLQSLLRGWDQLKEAARDSI